jgi:hypothetical protein
MDPIEIPIATALGKTIIVGCCLLIVLLIFSWGTPKFVAFLEIAVERAPRKAKTRTIHIVLGFLVYALVFIPALVAAFAGVRVLTTPPTRISAEGVTGGTLACSGTRAFLFSCSLPLSFKKPRITIPWPKVQRVECVVRGDHAVHSLFVYSEKQRIEIGSFALGDLSHVHEIILANAPPAAARPCQGAFDAND